MKVNFKFIVNKFENKYGENYLPDLMAFCLADWWAPHVAAMLVDVMVDLSVHALVDVTVALKVDLSENE